MACRCLALVQLLVWSGPFPAAAQSFSGPHATRVYHIVFLKRHPERKALGTEEANRMQAAHMANIREMARRGVLVAAGPFDDTPPVISGVFFFVTREREEARQLAEADPTVAARRNTVEVLSWRGPAGIGDEYRRLHEERPGTPERMGMHPFLILRRPGKESNPALMAEHAAYWAGLRARGKIVAAGEVLADQSAVEIVIFNRIPDAEAARLTAADPAAGLLAAETHRWWCAANVFPR